MATWRSVRARTRLNEEKVALMKSAMASQQRRPIRTVQVGRLRITWGGGLSVWRVDIYHAPRYVGQRRRHRGHSVYLRSPWRTIGLSWVPVTKRDLRIRG